MRLICPNCDAEYEVDDSAIPDTGRDVQCSNCGHAWFQLPPEIELALVQEEELFGQAAAEAGPDVPPAIDPPTSAPLRSAPEAASVAPAQSAPTQPSEPPRRTLDENLIAILREEAEREAAARRSEGSGIETQPDLGLGAPQAPPPSAPAAAPSAAGGTAASGLAGAARRIAQMQGKDPDAPPPRPAARRDLLPDIEEINSSLKGGDVAPGLAEAGAEGAVVDDQRGFRSGFALSLFLALVLLAAYVAAPMIKAQIPAAGTALDAYVGGVDGLRLWLDGMMRSATDLLRGMAATDGA